MTNKFSMYMGDNEKLTITVYDSKDVATREPVPLSGAKAWFSVKKNYIDDDYEFQKRNVLAGGAVDEILMTNPASGTFEVYIIPTDTEGMPKDVYVYDVQVELSPYGKKTVIRNVFNLENDVTKD